MKITVLIAQFEKLLPKYKKAYDENWDWNKLADHNMSCGVCRASYYRLENVFIGGYYEALLTRGDTLFPYPEKGKDLKNRIDFMEREIKSLRRLIKRGYTHV